MKATRFLAALTLVSLWGVGHAEAQRNSAAFGATLRPEQIPVRPAIYMTQPVSATPTGYTPAQVAHAYGWDQISGTGSGQTIALIEFHGSATLQNDLDTFSQQFNLPSTTVTVLAPRGRATYGSPVWALQTTLDVEWAHAAAPGASLMVVLSHSDRLSAMLEAVDYAVQQGATQVVMCWGGAEFNTEQKYDYHFTQSGVTFIAASGDAVNGLQWPSTSPNVIGVGGTTLLLDAKGNVNSETAWKYSSGGPSAFELVPTWQTTWQNTQGRGVPDVSYLADPDHGVAVYMSHYGHMSGWFTLGGSGVGAVQWAGLYAVAAGGTSANPSATNSQSTTNSNSNQAQNASNQSTNNSGKNQGNSNHGNPFAKNGNSGNTNNNSNTNTNSNSNTANSSNSGAGSNTTTAASTAPELLYRIATASYSTDFRDITTGGNGVYNATDGYDFVTGLGSPLVLALAPELQGQQ